MDRHRQAERQTHRKRQRSTYRPTERQREKGRQTDRKTDTQISQSALVWRTSKILNVRAKSLVPYLKA